MPKRYSVTLNFDRFRIPTRKGNNVKEMYRRGGYVFRSGEPPIIVDESELSKFEIVAPTKFKSDEVKNGGRIMDPNLIITEIL